MYLLEEPNLRWCGFCLQPWPATLEWFAHHKYGRHKLSLVCRWCANQDRAIRYRLTRESPNREVRIPPHIVTVGRHKHVARLTLAPRPEATRIPEPRPQETSRVRDAWEATLDSSVHPRSGDDSAAEPTPGGFHGEPGDLF